MTIVIILYNNIIADVDLLYNHFRITNTTRLLIWSISTSIYKSSSAL